MSATRIAHGILLPTPAATGEPLSTTLLTKGRRVRRPGSIALTRALGTLVGRDASFVQFLSVRGRWMLRGGGQVMMMP